MIAIFWKSQNLPIKKCNKEDSIKKTIKKEEKDEIKNTGKFIVHCGSLWKLMSSSARMQSFQDIIHGNCTYSMWPGVNNLMRNLY